MSFGIVPRNFSGTTSGVGCRPRSISGVNWKVYLGYSWAFMAAGRVIPSRVSSIESVFTDDLVVDGEHSSGNTCC